MPPPRRALRTAALAVMAATPLLAGCSEAESDRRSAGGAPAGVLSRPAPTTPATSAGELTRDSLPAPAALGPGWHYRVDKGNTEDGYVGNGTPSVARDPAEVAAVLSPLGCRPVRLPIPVSALEVTYAHRDGTPAVGLKLAFEDADTAADFFDTRADAVRDCVEWTRARAKVTVLRDRTDLFVSTRDEGTGGTPVWTEGVRRTEAQVLFVAVSGEVRPTVVEAALS